ncbi:MAG: tRNA pseudouridine(38-40) synthase TruA [Thermoplasmata archaeon]|nr:tRNA pseudouridine(38-40) synthase TruA [Thermoplasmata archaeon]
MRTALRIAYVGTRFEGYPRMPGRRTVEGALLEALSEQMDDARLRSGSRTDRGVSALANVVAVDSTMHLDPWRLNARMEDVWVTGIATVCDDFEPRHADSRWYRYHLIDPMLDARLCDSCARIFVGVHDFSGFARVDARDTVRELLDSRVTAFDAGGVRVLALDVRGRSFLWTMVRRIAGAVSAVGAGRARLEDVRMALDGHERRRAFPTAPPEPLVLMLVDAGISFEPVRASRSARDAFMAMAGRSASSLALAGSLLDDEER